MKTTYAILPSLLVALAPGCSSTPAQSSSASPAPASAIARTPASRDREAWRRLVRDAPLPKHGCFHVTWPSTTWEEEPCGTAVTNPRPPRANLQALPRLSIAPGAAASTQTTRSGSGTASPAKASRLTPDYINGNGDYEVTDSALLSWAQGSFPLEIGGGNEGSTSPAQYPGANSYSLELNTNTFVTPLCQGQSGCLGWQQFAYDPKAQQLFSQYWLIHFSGSCPGLFTSNYTAPNGEQDCYFESGPYPVPAEPATALADIVLAATTAGTTDTLFLDIGGSAYEVSAPSFMALPKVWTDADFNVYGEGSGAEAIFSDPTTLEVQIETQYNPFSYLPPSCRLGPAPGGRQTQESNSMSLNGACCAFGGATPGIRFTESTVAGAPASFVCPTAPNCSYRFSCDNDGQVSITCTPDGTSPSDPINIYQVVSGTDVLDVMPQVAQGVFTSTITTPTVVGTVTTVPNSAQTSLTFVGCTDTPWGGKTCDPVPTTVSTPSCVGTPCVWEGANGAWDGDGQCVVPCVPGTCGTLGKGCGTWGDGCGGQVTCGTCATDMACDNGTCVGTGGPKGNFCEECAQSGGVCTSSNGKAMCIHE